MKTLPKVIYLAYGGAEVTVFDSQVTALLKHLKGNADVRLVGFQSWFNYYTQPDFLRSKSKEIKEVTGHDPIFFPRIPRNLGDLNSYRLKGILNQYANEPVIIHARGVQSAAMAVSMKKFFPKLKVILDHRGLEAEEFLYILEKEKRRLPTFMDRFWFKRLQALERQAVEGADRVLCVSRALLVHLECRYGNLKHKGSVIPGSVDTGIFHYDPQERRKIRKSLGLEYRLVLIYAGTLRAWQEGSILARVFRAAKRADPKSYLMVLTPHKSEAIRHLKGADQGDYCVLNLKHKDVPEYLASGDIGILTREVHLVNQVASPTKGPEYLATGNMILVTPHPQDLGGLIKTEGIGAVVMSGEDEAALEKAILYLKERLAADGDTLRKKARDAAQKYYSWESNLPKILKTYEELA